MAIFSGIADSAMSEPDYHYRSTKMAEDSSRMSMRTPRLESGKVYSVDSYVQNTVSSLPQTMDKIAQLRSVTDQLVDLISDRMIPLAHRRHKHAILRVMRMVKSIDIVYSHCFVCLSHFLFFLFCESSKL
jgi:hypothetical protein